MNDLHTKDGSDDYGKIPTGTDITDIIARFSLYVMAFLLPIWVLPMTFSPISFNKAYLAYFLVIIGLVAWLVGSLRQGDISLPKNFIILALLAIVAAFAVSAIFSISHHNSIIGFGHESNTLFAWGMFLITAFLASRVLRSSDHIFAWLTALLFSSVIVFVVQLLITVAGFSPIGSVFVFTTSNLIGSWPSFGIYWSLIGFIALFLFEYTSVRVLRMFFAAVMIMSVLSMMAVNFRLVWWVLGAFLVIFFAYSFSSVLSKRKFFTASFLGILIVLLFIQAPLLVSFVPDYLNTPLLEVRPSWSSTWSVVEQSIKENPVLGSGPNTFSVDWIKHKPSSVNQTQFWNIRFSSGAGFIPSLFATVGSVGAAALTFLVLAFLYYAFRGVVFSETGRKDSLFMLSLMLSAMSLTFLIFYTPDFFIILFAFIVLGIFMGLLSKHNLAGEYTFKYFQNYWVAFMSMLASILVFVASVSALYTLAQKYLGAYYYGRGLSLLNSGQVVEAQTDFSKAIGFDDRDTYFRSLVSAQISQMSVVLGRQDLSQEELRSRFQNILGSAVSNGRQATNLNPVDDRNWSSLAGIYASVVPLGVEGAEDSAIAMYDAASEINPLSPAIPLSKANVKVRAGKLDEAESLVLESIDLKNNYVSAHLLLSQIAERQGNINEAINRARAAQFLSPNDTGTLFQLGLLYYRSDNLDGARQAFERIAEIEPNYSNGRYFLGLTYDRLGDKESAIRQFEKIRSLNPGNNEVAQIISNLSAGRNALENISPPAPIPEERIEPPIEE